MSRKSRKSAGLVEQTGSAPKSLGRKLLRLVVLAGLGVAASKVLRSATGTAPVATPAPSPAPRPTPAPAPKVEATPPPAVEIPTSPVEPAPAPDLVAEALAATPTEPAAEPAADPDEDAIERLETEAPVVPAAPEADTLQTRTPKSQTPEVPADSLTSFFDDVLTENEDAKRKR